MDETNDLTFHTFVLISKHRMIDHYLPKLIACIKELPEETLTRVDYPGANSIVGICMHICEHLQRQVKRYSDSGVVFDKGIEDYFPNDPISRQELFDTVGRAFRTWAAALDQAAHLEMQGLYHLVEHTGYHLDKLWTGPGASHTASSTSAGVA